MKCILDLREEECFWRVEDDVFSRCQSERLSSFFDFVLIGDSLREEFCENPQYLEKVLTFLCDVGDIFYDFLNRYKNMGLGQSKVKLFVKKLFLYVENEIDSRPDLIMINGYNPKALGVCYSTKDRIDINLPTYKTLCDCSESEYKQKTEEYMIVYLHEFMHRFLSSTIGRDECRRRFFSFDTINRDFVDVNNKITAAPISLYELIYQDVVGFIYDGEDASEDIQKEMVEYLSIESDIIDSTYSEKSVAEEYFIRVCELMIKYGMRDLDSDEYFPNIKRGILFAKDGVVDRLSGYLESFGLDCEQENIDDSCVGKRSCLFSQYPVAKKPKLTQSPDLRVVRDEDSASSAESSPALRTL